MHTWIDEVTEALEDLGGEATLPEIINQVRKRNKKKIKNESSIRQALEDNCPQKSFRTGVPRFNHKGSERSGVYELIREKEKRIKEEERNVEIPEADTPQAQDFDEPVQPERILTKVYRVLRDTKLARQIKYLHNNRCQICGCTIDLQNGNLYAEAHHIQPLGSPHNGLDVAGNIICVCPNHHVQLDYGVIRLEKSLLKMHPNHTVDDNYIDYHNLQIFQKFSSL